MPQSDSRFPYADIIYFDMRYNSYYLLEYILYNDIVDNIYCIDCIKKWEKEGILKICDDPDNYDHYYERSLHMSIEELQRDIGWLHPYRYSTIMVDQMIHKTYMKEITNRLLLRCFMKNISHPYKDMIFDNNVQEKILSYL